MATRSKIKNTIVKNAMPFQNVRTHVPIQQRLKMLLIHHLQTAVSSLGRFCRAPVASILTTLVIAIALALPAGLYVILNNIKAVTHHWDVRPQISIFMQEQWPESKTLALAETLRKQSGIAEVEYISPAAGWDMFQTTMGMEDVLAALPDNPLPAVLRITPDDMSDSNKWIAEFQKKEGVEFVQLDSEWVERLQGFLTLGQHIALMLEIFLGMAVFLIIGNTIRLMLMNRQQEIEIMQWVGATNAFIRRPFLYMGLCYGIMGAFVAWIILFIGLTLLENTATSLLLSYNSQFRLLGAGIDMGLNLIIVGALVGWVSAYLFSQYYLRQQLPK